MKRFFLFPLLVFFFLYAPSVHAIVDPLSSPNNKFGIHLAVVDDRDVEDSARLVNSNGGDWGYATVVIQEDDRNHGKWQGVFDRMRRLHLIPIVRIATKGEAGSWRRPTKEEAGQWAEFLNSLNWVVRNRYVVLFNEANHASEWGGAVDPEDYAAVSLEFAKKLKEKDSDFFVLIGGADQAAPNIAPQYIEAGAFYDRVVSAWTTLEPEFESYIDGIASHSYPNPGFAGGVYEEGQATVRGYKWELSRLRSSGIDKSMYVFITETGWRMSSALSEDEVAARMSSAYKDIWMNDDYVIAVTPFIFNYQTEPFLGFSWKKQSSDEFYPVYKAIQDLPKKKGIPEQITAFEVLSYMPRELVADSRFEFGFKVKNVGQTIWDNSYTFELFSKEPFLYYFSPVETIYPTQEANISFHLQTPVETGKRDFTIAMMKDKKKTSDEFAWSMRVVPNIDMQLTYSLWGGMFDKEDKFSVEFYNSSQKLVYKKINVKGKNGKIILTKVRNVALNEKYRVVVLKPGYLPRQNFVKLHLATNKLSLKPMLPLDWNSDGRWSPGDLLWFL